MKIPPDEPDDSLDERETEVKCSPSIQFLWSKEIKRRSEKKNKEMALLSGKSTGFSFIRANEFLSRIYNLTRSFDVIF